ncbi:MAG: hypothetical protein J6T84_05125 [Spirochaetaceae bacterium]|nr:hypothetical protein [Spirochaetaceae bacterium]
MKKLLSFLLITVFVLVLTACGGGGGGGGGVSSSPSSGSPAGNAVSYSPAYTYNVPADKTSSIAYLIRSDFSKRSLPTPGATSYASVAEVMPDSQPVVKRFAQNMDEWHSQKVAPSFNDRILASVATTGYQIGNEKDFYVINFNDNSTTTKTFVLKKDQTNVPNVPGQPPSRCRVWYDKNDPNGLTDSQLETIRTKLDKMFDVETALCGSMVPTCNWDNIISINTETKLDIVVYAMTNNYLGYFSPRDFFTSGENSVFSNKAPIIYISSTDTSSNMYSTVSHEFDHLLNFVNKEINHDKDEETWYTELLSNTIEEVLENFNEVSAADSIRNQRLPWFLARYNFGLFWDQNDIYGSSYSNVYAFGAWLVRNYGGPELFHLIATNAYVNEESIVRAVNALNGTNETFASLRLKFAESLIYTDEGCGKPNFNTSIYDINFFPGVTFYLPTIDLYDYTSLSNYSGPVIFNPQYHFSDLYSGDAGKVLPYGFEIQNLGTGLSQIEIPSNYYGDFTVVFK